MADARLLTPLVTECSPAEPAPREVEGIRAERSSAASGCHGNSRFARARFSRYK